MEELGFDPENTEELLKNQEAYTVLLAYSETFLQRV